jgi:hypothetical protein
VPPDPDNRGGGGRSGDSAQASAPSEQPKAPRKKPPERALPDEAYTLAAQLLDWITRNHPRAKVAQLAPAQRDATIARWADPLDKLHRIDGQSWGEISAMIDWSGRSDFWHRVILSGGNLREHWDKMAAQRGERKSTTRATGRVEPRRPNEYDDGEQHL